MNEETLSYRTQLWLVMGFEGVLNLLHDMSEQRVPLHPQALRKLLNVQGRLNHVLALQEKLTDQKSQ